MNPFTAFSGVFILTSLDDEIAALTVNNPAPKITTQWDICSGCMLTLDEIEGWGLDPTLEIAERCEYCAMQLLKLGNRSGTFVVRSHFDTHSHNNRYYVDMVEPHTPELCRKLRTDYTATPNGEGNWR